MKKLSIVIISSLLFLLCTSLVCFILGSINFSSVWIPFGIGVGILIVSVVVAFSLKKVDFVKYMILIANSIALGFLIRTWHIFRNYHLDFWMLTLISLMCIVYLLVFYLISLVPLFSKYYKTYIAIFLILSIVTYILLIIYTTTTYISTYGYYMIIEIGFILALSVDTKSCKELVKALALSTFSVIIVAIIIGLIMLEADFDLDLTGFDFDFVSPRKQKEK